MSDNAREEVKAVALRLPEALHAQVAAEAESDLRSLNSEIIVLLREALEARRKKRNNAEIRTPDLVAA